MLIGDSNFGKIRFGEGKGTIGRSTPGYRAWAPEVKSIDPAASASYKRVAVMVGTNDLKPSEISSDEDIRKVYKEYKTKITQIRDVNPKCKLLICPVLPSKSHDINRKINIFNNYLYEDLVEGLELDFLDKQTNLLHRKLAVDDPNDYLHINDTHGVRLLVRSLKRFIFGLAHNRVVSRRTYANTTSGGVGYST